MDPHRCYARFRDIGYGALNDEDPESIVLTFTGIATDSVGALVLPLQPVYGQMCTVQIYASYAESQADLQQKALEAFRAAYDDPGLVVDFLSFGS